MKKEEPKLNLDNISEKGNYDLHVAYLEKEPSTIELSSNLKSILHMFLGINDEVNELETAILNISRGGLQDHVTNFVEEMGDLLFYVTGLRMALREPITAQHGGDLPAEDYLAAYADLVSTHVESHGVIGGSYANLNIPGLQLSNALSLIFNRIRGVMPVFSESIKRLTMYGEVQTKQKEGGPAPVVHVEQMLDICAHIEANVLVLAATTSIPLDHILRENFKKLSKRYANGYSDAAASERADKEDENVVSMPAQ